MVQWTFVAFQGQPCHMTCVSFPLIGCLFPGWQHLVRQGGEGQQLPWCVSSSCCCSEECWHFFCGGTVTRMHTDRHRHKSHFRLRSDDKSHSPRENKTLVVAALRDKKKTTHSENSYTASVLPREEWFTWGMTGRGVCLLTKQLSRLLEPVSGSVTAVWSKLDTGFFLFSGGADTATEERGCTSTWMPSEKKQKGLRYTCVTQRYQRGDRGKQTCTSCPVSSMTLHWNNVKSELLASKRKQKISKNGYPAVKSQHCLFTASCWTTPDTVQALIILYHCVLYWNILYCLLNKNPITDGGTKVIPWLFKHVFFNQKVVKDIFSYEYGVHRAFSFFIMIPTAFFSQTLWVNVGAG